MAFSTAPDVDRLLMPIPIELQVEIDYYTGEFQYRYDISELVVAKGQQLLIRLNKDKVPPGSTVHIVGYSSTHPLLLPLDEPRLGSAPFPVDKPFPDTTDSMLLTLVSEYRQLVSFGTHVYCKFTDASGQAQEYTKLCDPQVGNGPP
jgi:hypothetical protein